LENAKCQKAKSIILEQNNGKIKELLERKIGGKIKLVPNASSRKV